MQGLAPDDQLDRVIRWHLSDDYPVLRQALHDTLVHAMRRYYGKVTVSRCATFVDLLVCELERYRFRDPAPETVDLWRERLTFGLMEIERCYQAQAYTDRMFHDMHLYRFENALAARAGMNITADHFHHLLHLFRWLWHVVADDRALQRWHYRQGA